MKLKTSKAQKKSSVMRTPKIKRVKGWAFTFYGKTWGFRARNEKVSIANLKWHKAKIYPATLLIEL